MDDMMASGAGGDRVADRGICIWHLISSIGVRIRLVKAPLAAPQATSAGKGSLSAGLGTGKVDLRRVCAMR